VKQGQLVGGITTHGAIPYPGIPLWARINGCDLEFTQILIEAIQRTDIERARRNAGEISQYRDG
jgi:hypothetical protein